MFGVYGAASRALRGGDPARPLAAHEVFAAGGVAGGANALVLAPVELVRNRFQVAAGRTTLRAAPRRVEIKQEHIPSTWIATRTWIGTRT
jgi:hypothetical protein